LIPETLYPEPATVACEIVTVDGPAFVIWAVCDVLLPTNKLPNEIVVGLAVSVPGDVLELLLEEFDDVAVLPPQPLRTATSSADPRRRTTPRVVETG
jgi:hypothetical protein